MPVYSFMGFLLCWVVLGLLTPASAQNTSELRDPAVLYLDENLPQPLHVKLKAAAAVFSGKDGSLRLATLPADHSVQIIGLETDLLLIQTTFRGQQISGWIEANQVPALDPSLLETARKNQTFNRAVLQAIKDKKVIEGMSLEDVQKSLGKPNRTSFRQEAGGRIDTWYFITYETRAEHGYEKNSFGQIVPTVHYIKVPVGETVVEFNNSRVSAVEQHTQNSKANRVIRPLR